jgi:hypothetical protein
LPQIFGLNRQSPRAVSGGRIQTLSCEFTLAGI